MTLDAGRSTPEGPGGAVCPHCVRPFEPGADYCTHCGSGLGIAETQIQPIPLPNSDRFHERHQPGAPAPRRSWVRAVALFWIVCILSGFVVTLVYLAGGRSLDGLDDDELFAWIVVMLGALVAAVLYYWRSRRARSSGV